MHDPPIHGLDVQAGGGQQVSDAISGRLLRCLSPFFLLLLVLTVVVSLWYRSSPLLGGLRVFRDIRSGACLLRLYGLACDVQVTTVVCAAPGFTLLLDALFEKMQFTDRTLIVGSCTHVFLRSSFPPVCRIVMIAARSLSPSWRCRVGAGATAVPRSTSRRGYPCSWVLGMPC